MRKLILSFLFLMLMSVATANTWESVGYDISRSYTQPTSSVSSLSFTTINHHMSNRELWTEPLVYDIDGDSSNEMIFSEDGIVYIYDSNLQIQAQINPSVYGYSTILSNPIIFKMNYTYSTKQIGMLVQNGSKTDFLGFNINNAVVTRVFKVVGIQTTFVGNYSIMASDKRATNLYYFKDRRYLTIYNDNNYRCRVDLGSNDSKYGILSQPPNTDIYGNSWQGDFNNDGYMDVAFWHNSHILVYSENCVNVLDYNAGAYYSANDKYNPIVFLNFDGGNLELATTTSARFTGGARSYVIALTTGGSTVFAPYRRNCPTVSGTPDAPYLNAIPMNFDTRATGAYAGDELVTAVACMFLCTGCPSGTNQQAIMFEYFNENGYQNGKQTGLNSTSGSLKFTNTRSNMISTFVEGGIYSKDFVVPYQDGQYTSQLGAFSARVNSSGSMFVKFINKTIYSYPSTTPTNQFTEGGVTSADLNSDGKNDLIFTDRIAQKIYVGLTNNILPVTAVIEVRDYYTNALISGVTVCINTIYCNTTNYLGRASYSLLVASYNINATYGNYNEYREISKYISAGTNIILLKPILKSSIIFDNVYNALWFDNFTDTVREISKDGWNSNGISYMNSEGLQGINYQTFGKQLAINATSGGITYIHKTYITGNESEIFFHIRPSSICDYPPCNDYSTADGITFYINDNDGNIATEFRVWYNKTGSIEKYYVDYYDGSWNNCLKSTPMNDPLVFKVMISGNKYDLYVYNDSNPGNFVFPIGSINWRTCVENKTFYDISAIPEYFKLVPQQMNSGIHYLDYVTTGDRVGTSCIGNQLPTITSIGYSTGNPICYNDTQDYQINSYDKESDYKSFKVDCYGNGSWSDWTILAQSTIYGYPCYYGKVGTFEAKFQITDLCRYPSSTGVVTSFMQVVSTTNCYTRGQGSSLEGELSTDIAGWKGNFTDNLDGYNSDYLDFGSCNSWQQGWRVAFLWLCPFYSLVMAILITIFNWVFSAYFGAFLIIVLIIAIYIALRRKR